jgi:hypothetical protein
MKLIENITINDLKNSSGVITKLTRCCNNVQTLCLKGRSAGDHEMMNNMFVMSSAIEFISEIRAYTKNIIIMLTLTFSFLPY